MSTSLKPIDEEQPPPIPVATTSEAKPDASTSCCTVATEADNESFSVHSIPFELLECTKLNLQLEVVNLEYEFRQLKEALYEARIAQVDRKLDELRRADASELLIVNEMVDGLYDERKQVRALIFLQVFFLMLCAGSVAFVYEFGSSNAGL